MNKVQVKALKGLGFVVGMRLMGERFPWRELSRKLGNECARAKGGFMLHLRLLVYPPVRPREEPA